MKKLFYIYLMFIVTLSWASEDPVGTIYTRIDIPFPYMDVATYMSMDVIIDSIVLIEGGAVFCADPCLNEYQSFRLHSFMERAIADVELDSFCICTGSPCYREIYEPSPFDLDRELVARACYFLAPDSAEVACADSTSAYEFVIHACRPGSLLISLTEEYVTDSFETWHVVSDTVKLRIGGGAAIECVPLKKPQCIGFIDVTPLDAKAVWHHVMLHDGYEFSFGSSEIPPEFGTRLDTNYYHLEPLLPGRAYYVHVRAWADCETSGETFSEWETIYFETPRQPETVIKTNPENLMVVVDSDTYYTVHTFSWPYEIGGGPCHWLEAVTPQHDSPGPIYKYKSWSDGGAQSHCHYVGPTDVIITCFFDSLFADFVEQEVPESSICAESEVPVSVTMMNIGSIEWYSTANVYLVPIDDIWGISSVPIESDTVAPLENYTFEFDIIAPDAPGIYPFCWIMQQDSSSCFGAQSDTIWLDVVEKPDAEASSPGPFCEGDDILLEGGPDDMISYAWICPDSSIIYEQNPNLGAGDTSISGTYILTVTNGHGCEDIDSTVVVIYPKPVGAASDSGPYCGDETIELFASPDLMASYEWAGSAGFESFLQNPTIPDALPENSGIYTVIVTNEHGCADTAFVDVVVNERPIMEAYSTAPVCEGSFLQVWAYPPELDSYLWILPDSSTLTTGGVSIPSAGVELEGIWMVIGTTVEGCIDTGYVDVRIDTTIKTLAIESVTADSYFIYEGSATGLHCEISGGEGEISFRWSPDSTVSSPDSAHTLATPPHTTVYTVTVSDSQECGIFEVSEEIMITVYADFTCSLYIDTLTHDLCICRGNSVDLFVGVENAFGDVQYSWTPSNWLSDTDIPNPVSHPDSTIFYTIIVIDDSGCVDIGSVTIMVVEPTVDAEPDSAWICRGDNLILSALPSGGREPYSFQWYPVSSLESPESPITLAFPDTNTLYRIRITDSTGCIAWDTIAVFVDTIIPGIAISPSTDNDSILYGESTRLHANLTGAVGDVGYQWTPELFLDIPHSPNPWASPDVSGWFILTASDTQGVCVNILVDSVYVFVEDTSACTLRITGISQDSSVCPGESLALWVEITGAEGILEYNWYPAEFLSNPHIANPIAFPDYDTEFLAVVSEDSCFDSASVFIAVDEVDTSMEIAFAWAENETINIGDSTILHVLITDAVGDISVSWTPAGFLSYPESTETWAFPNMTTTFIVIASDSQRCGVHYETAMVDIYVDTWPGCSLDISAGDMDTICPGDSTTLHAAATSAYGSVYYSWNPVTGLSSPDSATTEASPTATTLYTVTAIDDSGCADTASVRVRVTKWDLGDLPELEICRGETLILPVSISWGNTPISWRWSPGNSLDDSTSDSPLCFPDTTIEYTITATDAGGCELDTTISIHVDTILTAMGITLSADTTIPGGGIALLSAEITGAIGSVSFFWEPEWWLDNPLILNPMASPLIRTVYYFTAHDTQECGVYTIRDSVIIDVLTSPECSLSIESIFAETTICCGGTVELGTSVHHALGTVDYDWTPITWLDNPTSPNPVVEGIDTTILYTVTAYNDSNCTDTASVLIQVPRAISALSTDIRICYGDTISLYVSAEYSHEPVSWEWTPMDYLSAPFDDTTLTFPQNSITYYAKFTDSELCTDSISFTITVDTVVTTMSIEAFVAPDAIVNGDSVLLSVLISAPVGSVSVSWTDAIPISDPISSITWGYPTESCWIPVTVSDNQECGVFSQTDSVFVIVEQLPCSLVVHASGDDTICKGDSISISATVEFAVGDVTWLWRPGELFDDSTSQNPMAEPEVTTYCTVIAIDSTGCTDSASLLLTVLPTPVAVAVAEQETVFIHDTIHLHGFPDDTSLAYHWVGPSGFETYECTAVIENAAPINSGWYILSIINSYGCTGYDSVYVFIESELPETLAPAIEVSPPALFFELLSGDSSQTLPLLVENAGDTILDILDIDLQRALVCFDFEPDTILPIEPGEIDTIYVTFSFTSAGAYYDTLQIISTDPDNPAIKILFLGIAHEPAQPDIEIFPDAIDFGETIIDSCGTDFVRIYNTGNSELVVYEIEIERPDVDFLRPELPDTLSPTMNRDYVFQYCPHAEDSLNSWITIINNDPLDSILLLLVMGMGIEIEGYNINTEVVTPNGDGMNDVLRFIIPQDVEEWRIEIYNSRGSIVKSGKFSSWNAMENDSPIPIGTYYYRLSSDGEIKLGGSFAVIY